MKQIPLALGPEGNPRFDDYVIGAKSYWFPYRFARPDPGPR